MEGQLASSLDTVGGPTLVLSGSKEVEPGARAALLLADGLFRLDVLVQGDALQTFVRNFSAGELELRGPQSMSGGGTSSCGAAPALSPGRADMGFALGTGADRLLVRVTLGTLRLAERGTVRVSALAIARRATRTGGHDS